MTLSDASNANLGTDSIHTYTIFDNDAPMVAFDTTASSDDESVTPATLVVNLTAASEETITVDYAVTGGTATDTADYTLAAGTLTFDPGEVSDTIAITIVDDSLAEAD